MTNILEAIFNISQLEKLTVKDITFGNNRATSVGDGLESFIKDAFTNTFNETDKKLIFEDIDTTLYMYKTIITYASEFEKDEKYTESLQKEFINTVKLFENLIAEDK